MVGIKDVARIAGVSIGTVSNVVNRPHVVSAATRSRVLSVIQELGYVRDESARQLRAGRSRTLAVLVLDLGNPFFVDVAQGAEQAAQAEGLNVITCNSGQRVDREARAPGDARRAAGARGAAEPGRVGGGEPGALPPQRDLRTCSWIARCRTPTRARCRWTTWRVAHWRRGTSRGRAHHIAFVNGPQMLVQCRDREAGARAALAEARARPTLRCWSPRRWTWLPGVTPVPACSASARGRRRCSAPTTCSRSACCRRWSRRGCGCRRRWRSSATTTSSSPRPPPCRSPRSGSRPPGWAKPRPN